MDLKYIKFVGDFAIYQIKSTILKIEIDEEAKQIIEYYNHLPANL